MITSKHANRHLGATEEDRPNLITGPLVVADIALHHFLEESHRQRGMEVVQPRETVI